LSEKQIRIRLTESAVDHLIDKGFDAKMGARPLAKTINDLIKVPISKKILFENLANGSIISIDYNDSNIVMEVIAHSIIDNTPTVDFNGFIRLENSQ
jgi:ATP-dependent Clp protease ATP-binding subunit ClpA